MANCCSKLHKSLPLVAEGEIAAQATLVSCLLMHNVQMLAVCAFVVF